MNDRNIKAISAIKGAFSVKATPSAKGTTLEFTGTADLFTLSTANDEYTIFTRDWHAHFPDIEQLTSFLTALFTGTAKIMVKYRGKCAVAYQIQILKDGQWIVMSQTGSLISPFWKPISYRTIGYENCQQSVPAYVAQSAPSAEP